MSDANGIHQVIASFIRAYWLEHGYSPTVREITEACFYHSTSATSGRLRQMRARGMVLFDDNIARSFRLSNQKTIFED